MIGAGAESRALFLFPSTTASRALRGTVMNRLSSRMLTAFPDREIRAAAGVTDEDLTAGAFLHKLNIYRVAV